MLINGKQHRSVEIISDNGIDNHKKGKVALKTIDQRLLPFKVVFITLESSDQVIAAISKMQVRGAPIIGIVAAFGVVMACEEACCLSVEHINKKAKEIIAARPTAVNTENYVQEILDQIKNTDSIPGKKTIALNTILQMIEKEVNISKKIGLHGLDIIKELSKRKNQQPVNILTHCNAGWLACVDFGTATSPIYLAHKQGIKVHVWVDETRPRNQGARLTVWELTENGINNTLITDNTGGYLMSNNMVDMVIVGSDRTMLNGDTANKIGTYLKAVAAKDNNIPFYIALPSGTIAWNSDPYLSSIPIETRSNDEVKFMEGSLDNRITSVLITTPNAKCFNPGFDVTPARLITALITERGLCSPNKESIYKLFPDKVMNNNL